MYVKFVLALIVFCSVLSITYSDGYDGKPYQGYYKKRVKYGPPKYYGRPNRGYSYNPPDDYSARKPKVSKRPTNNGAGDDFNNLIKQISQEDLDRIIEFADEKETKSPFESQPKERNFQVLINDFDEPNNKYTQVNDDDNSIFQDFIQNFDSSDNNNYNTVYEEPKPFSINSNRNNENQRDLDIGLTPPPKADFFSFSDFEDNTPFEYSTTTTEETTKIFEVGESDSKSEYETVYDIEEPKFEHNPSQPSFNILNSANIYDTSIVNLQNEESMLQSQIEYLQSQIKDGVVYTDSNMMPEENLPKPMNLRDEQETSYTNKVPTYAQPSNSYKLENFGNLPLMNYHSKKDSQSSYHVPHYTVTSLSKPSSYSAPTSSYSAPAPAPAYGPKKIPVESAPPASEAKYQSDAHLKAIKIWSHKSKGAAYTLHPDGTLSLENPTYGAYGH